MDPCRSGDDQTASAPRGTPYDITGQLVWQSKPFQRYRKYEVFRMKDELFMKRDIVHLGKFRRISICRIKLIENVQMRETSAGQSDKPCPEA